MTKLQLDLVEFLEDHNYVSPWIISDNAQNNLFAGVSSIVSVKKNDYLFRQGESNNSIYIVRTGRLRAFYLNNSGSEKCIYIVEKGGMIGEVSALDSLSNHATAFAITDATLFKINIKDFQRIMNLHPKLSLEVIQSLSYKVRLLCSELEYSVKSSVIRIAASLIALCVRYGVEQPDGSICISIRFTHEELANLNNMNRVTVSNIYRNLLKKGIISSSGSYVTVHNMEQLKNYLLH